MPAQTTPQKFIAKHLLSDLPVARLRVILRDTERLGGKNCQSVKLIRRALRVAVAKDPKARLAAVAPELLAAAKRLVSRSQGPSGGRLVLEIDCLELEAVIAKAEGR